MYRYNAKVIRVVDGDTFHANVDLGFNITVSHMFRLVGIDTPETWRPKTDAERKHGEQATEYVKDLIEGETISIETFKMGIYGRYGATVILQDGRKLVDILKEQGYEKLDSYED